MEEFDVDEMVTLSKRLDEKERQEQERGFFWHWQNLKDKRHLLNGRAWLHRRRGGVFGVQWCIPGFSFGIKTTIGGMEEQIRFSVALWLFALYFKIEDVPLLNRWKVAKGYHGKCISLAIHHWALWWNIWTDENEWHSRTPKWRDGCFHIDNFLLGKNKYSNVEQAPIAAVIHMPEGDYTATVTPFEQTWKRPRWPLTKRKSGMEVEIEGGIPIPGKGENSWDCDDDAYMSVGTLAITVEDAIADVVKRVNERRARYGGKNWAPVKVQ